MQSIYNAFFGANPTNDHWNSEHAPSCPKYLEHLARTTATAYARFLELVQGNLANADDEAMQEMLELIGRLKPMIHNLQLIQHNELSSFPYDSVNAFDLHIVSAMEVLAHQRTSPQSAQMRKSLIPMITVRRILLSEFTSQGSVTFICINACYTHKN